MAERPVLAPRLRELDETIARRGMPPGARARVGARLRQEALRREATAGFRFRWLPALTFAAGAALVLLVVGLRLGGSTSPVRSEPTAATVFGGAFSVQGEGCRHRERAPVVELDGTCRLSAPQLSVHTWGPVQLRDDGDLRLLDGTAMFDVTTVAKGEAPTRILVSHGVIEVLGTRFTIEQGPHGGHVDLFEGSIRFVDLEGVVTEIAPGQRHAWGDVVAELVPRVDEGASAAAGAGGRGASHHDAGDRAGLDAAAGSLDVIATNHAAPPPEAGASPAVAVTTHAPPPAAARRPSRAARRRPETTASAQPPPQAGPDEATTIIDEVTRLRAEGRYAEAADVLRRADRTRRWDDRTAQVLSYELGEIIERHLGDDQAACAHWARHAERWPLGRYARAVSDARQRLGCPTEPSPAAR